MPSADELRTHCLTMFEGDVPAAIKRAFEKHFKEPFNRTAMDAYGQWIIRDGPSGAETTIVRLSRERLPPHVGFVQTVEDKAPPKQQAILRHKALPIQCLRLPPAACFMKGWGAD